MTERHGATWYGRRHHRRRSPGIHGSAGRSYFGCVAKAIRKHDPNHLYLGSRFYSTDRRNPR
jgi:hypothetical protein